VSVTFSDERKIFKTKKSEKFSTDIPLEKFGAFLMQLQTIHLAYIEKLQNIKKS